jgi:hypothetical protein
MVSGLELALWPDARGSVGSPQAISHVTATHVAVCRTSEGAKFGAPKRFSGSTRSADCPRPQLLPKIPLMTPGPKFTAKICVTTFRKFRGGLSPGVDISQIDPPQRKGAYFRNERTESPGVIQSYVGSETGLVLTVFLSLVSTIRGVWPIISAVPAEQGINRAKRRTLVNGRAT